MKIFISQPMRGKTEEHITEEREMVKHELSRRFEKFTIIDSYFKDFNGNAVQALGKSIQLLGEADLIVIVGDISEARGCKIEERVAMEYKIDRIYLRGLE